MALFQSNTGSGSGSKNIVEFKCGKMTLSGSTVTADKRKGQLFIYRDDCTHFCWKDRTSGKTEDDLIVFPNDAEMEPVAQCPDGRVVLLKFKEGNKKLFFWMQEPASKKDKDEELIKKVNDALNNPSRAGSHGRSGDDTEALMQLLSSGASSQSQIQQLQSLLQQSQRGAGGGGSSSMRSSSSSSAKKEEKPKPKVEPKQEATPSPTTATATPSTPAASQPVQIEDLQSILRNMTGGNQPSQTPIDIAEAMKAEDIIPMLANEQIREKLSAHLPADSSIPKTEAELKETLRSPQFQQACDAFSHALSSGQLGAALAQFGVNQAAVDAANKGDVRAFAAAMEKDKETGNEATNEEQMQTD